MSALPDEKRMSRVPAPWQITLIVLAMAGVFAIDLVTPLGLTAGILYAPVVLATILLRNPRLTLVTGAAAVILILLGWGMSPAAPADFPDLYVWSNRIFSVALILITAWLVRSRVLAFNKLEDAAVTELELRKVLDERHRLLTVASTVGALGGWVFNVGDATIQWSDQVARLHGLEPGQPAGPLEEALAFYAPEDQDMVRHCINDAIHHGHAYDYEARLIARDGRRLWVRSVGQPVMDANGVVRRLEGSFMDITAWKTAEDARRVSLMRFKQLAESMPLFVWTANADGTLDYVSQAFFDYAGAPGKEYPAEHWLDALHPDDRDQCNAMWQECVQTGQAYRFEFRVRRYDGCYRWHYAQALRLLDHIDGTLKWFGSVVDIHDKKVASEKAQRLAQRLSNTLESITDGLFTLDTDWNFTFLNKRAEQILQRSRHELIGRNVWVEFAPAVGTIFEHEYRRAMADQTAVVFEQYYEPLGLHLEVRAYPSENGLAVYFQDVTERWQSMAQLRLLQAAVTHLNDVIIITEAEPVSDPGPRIVFVNEAFERRTGYSRDEVIGLTPRILQGEGTSRTELSRIGQALARWEPVRAELQNYTKSGEAYWVELEIVPLANENGWYTHWVAVERDITERRNLQDRLQHLERMEALGQLTGGIAHDFNNLLTVILGNAELLAERVGNDPVQHGSVRLIQKAGSMGAELTRRLLAFARRQPLDPVSLDVNLVISDLRGMLRRSLGTGITLDIRPDPALWPALADPSRLEDALLNLVINARDAMPLGGCLVIETQCVRLDADYVARHVDLAAGDYVMIAMSDNGVGIKPEHMKHLFEPFFTTKAKDRGTGLGLAMVYGFLKQSGGHISVYSEPGQGTTFRLYLPRSGQQARSDSIEPSDPLPLGQGETILLVEDDALVRQVGCEHLLALGYDVIQAPGPAEALQALATHPAITLLLTDIMMPGMNGRELAARALALRPDLKILYTSGYTENAIMQHGHLDPGIMLLSKPYRRVDLARKIRLAFAAPTEPDTKA
ncbi:MAG: PAS domain S-box protein [Alcaligenaceae bacterium]|nr:PAS domain S-box protein [Alcaligenaceae bacterium]